MKAGIEPAEGRDLSKLASGRVDGLPARPEGFDWIYEQLGSDTWLFSTSGGTDVCTAFVGGVPTLPVYRGELQARALGADAACIRARRRGPDRRGRRARDHRADAVDADLLLGTTTTARRLRESYFDTYPGIWRHGDWIEITERGTAIIYGRSDSTINRGGVRIGTSEIYRAVLSLDEIEDALVVDVPRDGAESWMPLFVVLSRGCRARRRAEPEDRRRRTGAVLAPPCTERGPRDRRGPANALRQGARGSGQADPDGDTARSSGEP